MVVAVLVNQFFPSSRGLKRSGPEEAAEAGARVWSSGGNYDDKEYRNLAIPEEGSMDNDDDSQSSQQKHIYKHHRKRFRAMAALTSLASDLDVIFDWLFYFEAWRTDKEYREAVQEGDKPYLIPPVLLGLTLMTCILGTALWLVLASDGRVLTPLLKRLDVEKLSLGYILLACVLVEDIPQVVLTFLIEDYYEELNLSNVAVCNLTASLYDTLIKLAEAYDERNDVVETGAWCKKSIVAHRDQVTSVLAVPLLPSAERELLELSSRQLEREMRKRPSMTSVRSSRPSLRNNSQLPTDQSEGTFSLRVSIESRLPRLRFLTTSTDKSIRIWDTPVLQNDGREQCTQVMTGHKKGVTCVALLGTSKSYRPPTNDDLDRQDDAADCTTFFVAGCENGEAKLWNLNGECIRSYSLPSSTLGSRCGVTSVVPMRSGETFVCGYDNGSARIWEAFSGICFASYTGHGAGNTCLCTLQDENAFVSGSDADTCIRLWHTDRAMRNFHSALAPPDETEIQFENESFRHTSQSVDGSPMFSEMVCEKSFTGHTAPVLCLACLAPGKAIVSGSADGTARIWGIHRKRSLRILSGHEGPVQAVTVMDQTTVLTASGAVIRMFDALTGSSLREYDGHTGTVTALSATQDSRVFLSSSTDRTVKVWVITTISEKDTEESGGIDDLLDFDEFTGCNCGPIV